MPAADQAGGEARRPGPPAIVACSRLSPIATNPVAAEPATSRSGNAGRSPHAAADASVPPAPALIVAARATGLGVIARRNTRANDRDMAQDQRQPTRPARRPHRTVVGNGRSASSAPVSSRKSAAYGPVENRRQVQPLRITDRSAAPADQQATAADLRIEGIVPALEVVPAGLARGHHAGKGLARSPMAAMRAMLGLPPVCRNWTARRRRLPAARRRRK